MSILIIVDLKKLLTKAFRLKEFSRTFNRFFSFEETDSIRILHGFSIYIRVRRSKTNGRRLIRRKQNGFIISGGANTT